MSRAARFPSRETLPVGKDRSEVDDWYARESAFSRLDQIADRLVPPGGEIASQQARQSVLLLAGDHRGFEMNSTLWRVSGVPGATIRNRVVVTSGTLIFDNVAFRASDGQQNTAACVEVGASGRVVFNNCNFFRDARSAGVIILVANGGKAQLTGCVMEPANTATQYGVNNAGGALLVYLQGCVNLTGASHNNATVISELT